METKLPMPPFRMPGKPADCPRFKTIPDLEQHVFSEPKKEIKTEEKMKLWKNTVAYTEYGSFIKELNAAVQGKKTNSECSVSPITSGMLKILDYLDELVDKTPPLVQPQRFGNKAFKIWYEILQKEAPRLLKDNLPQVYHPAILELAPYLIESFGNSVRIDYGTGHEMSFCIFLFCAAKIGAFNPGDMTAVVLKIFNRYLELCRKLQLTYTMEPAGSHGVWSLDDFQFLPFLWGSSQFVGRPVIEPNVFMEPHVVDKYHADNMFVACIKYICQVKKGNFCETSPQLWNMSAVGSWSKINAGLFKMYDGEVLSKYPIMQHVLFGSLFEFVPQNT